MPVTKRYAIPDPEWDSLRDKTYSAKTMRLGKLFESRHHATDLHLRLR